MLTRDLMVDGERWAKGRRLAAADLDALARPGARVEGGPRAIDSSGFALIVMEPGDVHEDEAAERLAAAIAGPGLVVRGPAESRVELVAARAGVVHIRSALVERVDRIDPLEVFTVFDGQVVAAGDLVASVKVAPHVVPGSTIARAERIAARAGRDRLVRVAAFVPTPGRRRRQGVAPRPARERFEASVRLKVEALGSSLQSVAYVEDDLDAVRAALEPLVRGRGPARVDLVLTAGSASTDPSDPFFEAIDRLGGRVVRHGVPAHPGSMLWLARSAGRRHPGAADVWRLLEGDRGRSPAASPAVRRAGERRDRRSPRVGGILTRSMRFRFPAYARELDAPEG